MKKKVDDLSLQKKVDIWASEFERLKPPSVLVDRLSIKNMAVTQAVAERDGQIIDLSRVKSEGDWATILTAPAITKSVKPRNEPEAENTENEAKNIEIETRNA